MTGKMAHRYQVFIWLIVFAVMAIPILQLKPVLAADATLLHQFDFNGDLTDSLGTDTILTIHPNTATSGFGDGEWWWTAVGSPGGGLILDTADLVDPNSYSLGFRIEFNEVGPGWRKIVSFKGSGDDNGLYFYGNYLQFYPFGSNTAITYSPNTFYDFIFTRGSDNVIRVYIVDSDGTVTKVYEVNDPSDATVPIQVDGNYRFMLFMDDTSTSGEWTSGGTVRSIRLWNGVIDEDSIGDALSDVTTGIAVDITQNAATLQGSVNPYGLETAVYFEYGLNESYGTEVAADQSPITAQANVTKTISDLDANTTYHFRVKAVNSGGTIYGSDQTFTTTEPVILPVPVTGVVLDLPVLNLQIGGDSGRLEATVEPANADNKNVSWSSSDESVATVHDADGTAVVTAVGEGTAIVTVTTEDGGFTAQCVVTVLAQAEDEEELPNTGGLPFEVAGLVVLALGAIVKKSKH